jgi:hypothetical protein
MQPGQLRKTFYPLATMVGMGGMEGRRATFLHKSSQKAQKMKPKMTPEQENALAGAIKNAFSGELAFDATSVFLRANCPNENSKNSEIRVTSLGPFSSPVLSPSSLRSHWPRPHDPLH